MRTPKNKTLIETGTVEWTWGDRKKTIEPILDIQIIRGFYSKDANLDFTWELISMADVDQYL